MSRDIWVVLEANNGGIKETSLEVLSEARKLVRLRPGTLTVIATAGNDQIQRIVQAFGPDVVYLPPSETSVPSTQPLAISLVDLIDRKTPLAVLAAETVFGHEVLAEVSTRLRLPFLPDCVALAWDGSGRLVAERYWYSDRVSATLTGKASTLLASLRTGLFNVKREAVTSQPRVEILDGWPVSASAVHVLDFIPADPRTVDLADAEVIVSGGRGMGTAENFQKLWELADLLGAAVGGSRVARDNGWIPWERQIGQTGKNVSPKVIICCGISGATQHTFGMRDAKTVIAINKDKNAPIFKVADLGIVGDVGEVIPALIRLIKETR